METMVLSSKQWSPATRLTRKLSGCDDGTYPAIRETSDSAVVAMHGTLLTDPEALCDAGPRTLHKAVVLIPASFWQASPKDADRLNELSGSFERTVSRLETRQEYAIAIAERLATFRELKPRPERSVATNTMPAPRRPGDSRREAADPRECR